MYHTPLHLGFLSKSESELLFSPLQSTEGRLCECHHTFLLSFFFSALLHHCVWACSTGSLGFLITHRSFLIKRGVWTFTLVISAKLVELEGQKDNFMDVNYDILNFVQNQGANWTKFNFFSRNWTSSKILNQVQFFVRKLNLVKKFWTSSKFLN